MNPISFTFRRRHRLAILALVVGAALTPFVVVAGDCPLLGERRGIERPPIPDGLDVDPPLDSSEACPAWRWVATKRDASADCPRPRPVAGATWRTEPLFSSATSPVPATLARFCVYSHDERDPDVRFALERSLADLRRRGALRKIDSSCAALGPMAEGNEAIWPALEQHFLAQTRPVPMATATTTDALAGEAAPAVALDPPRVRLALLDTQPDGAMDGPGCSPHGFSLTRMAERLVCGGNPRRCAAEVVPRLALPIREFDWSDPRATRFDTASGGYFGTIEQLAKAVWRELEAWPDESETKLVLDLAVAWVGERFGGLERRPRHMPAPVEALYRTLEVASCRGALVVAAAGNRVLGPDREDGPLLPAGWERRPAPDRAACRRILADAESWRAIIPTREGDAERTRDRSVSTRREPLVYAAGGVHGNGMPLVNARPRSEPPRVAYADHAVVALRDEHGGSDLVDHCPDAEGSPRTDQGARGHESTAILTGSSVAATVVAAAAAVVWHHRPGLERAEVMALVEEAGQNLERRADVHLGARGGEPAPEVRRVGVCPALAHACGDDGRRCPGLGDVTCPEFPDQPPRLSEIALGCSVVDFAQAHRLDAATLDGALPGTDFCGADTLYYAQDGAAPAEPCPFRQSYGIHARPWTGPQPQTNPCSGCDIRPPPPQSGAPPPSELASSPRASRAATDAVMSLRIDIDADWRGGALTSAVLDLGDTHYALGLDALDAGDCAVVENLDRALIATASGRRARTPVLHFVTEHGTIEAPLFVGD